MRSHTRIDHNKRVKGVTELVEEEVDPSKPIVGSFITNDLSEIRDSSIGIGGISHLADYLVDELSFFPWTDTEQWKRIVLDLTLAKTNRGWFREVIKPAWIYEEDSDIWWTIPSSDSKVKEALVGVGLKERDMERRQLKEANESLQTVVQSWPLGLQKQWEQAVKDLNQKWDNKRTLAETRSRVITKFENFLLPPLLSEADETLAVSFFRSSRIARSLKGRLFTFWKEYYLRKRALLEAIWSNDKPPSKLIPRKTISGSEFRRRNPMEATALMKNLFRKWQNYYLYISSWDPDREIVSKSPTVLWVDWEQKRRIQGLPTTELQEIPTTQFSYDDIAREERRPMEEMEPMFSFRFLREEELAQEVQNLRKDIKEVEKYSKLVWQLDSENHRSIRSIESQGENGKHYSDRNRSLVVLHISNLEDEDWNVPSFAVYAYLGHSSHRLLSIIDSGAAISGLINEVEVRFLRLPWKKLKYEEVPFKCITANGQRLPILGVLEGPLDLGFEDDRGQRIDYELDDSNPKTRIYVCEALPAPLLIGLGIIRNKDLVLDAGKDLMLQGDNKFPCCDEGDPRKHRKPASDSGARTHRVCFTLSEDAQGDILREQHFFLNSAAAQRFAHKPVMPKLRKVFPLIEQMIHPASTERVLVWIENLKDKDLETPFVFTATLKGEFESDYLLWEGILEPSKVSFRSIMISNNTLETLTLTTDMLLGLASPLLERTLFFIAPEDTVDSEEKQREHESSVELLIAPQSESEKIPTVEKEGFEVPDENEIFDPGGHECAPLEDELPFPPTDMETQQGYFGVDPENYEYAATDEDLNAMLGEIPASRIDYFRRLLRRVRDRFTKSFYGEVWEGGRHTINLKPGTAPYKGRSFRFSQEHMELLKKLLEKWLEEGVCVPSKSSWGSPAFFVPKKEKGSWRFVVDYRELNKSTIPDRFPLPLIEDLFDQFSGDIIFSSFDCYSGFNQQAMDPNSQYLTAFTTPFGLFEMTRLSMGLQTAPSGFSRGITNTCRGLHGAKVYIDDVAISNGHKVADESEGSMADLEDWDRSMRAGREDLPPDEWDIHYYRVKKFLYRCVEFKLRLNPKKCKIGRDSIEYLGYIISKEGLKPNPAKVDAINSLVPPRNVKEIRIFMGMINYYRSFIRDCAELSLPLNDLLVKGRTYLWTEKHQECFEELKRRLADNCLRNHFDTSKECFLYTDCSDYACGAVLSQLDDQGNDVVIAYYSQSVSGAERRYSVYQKEALAILKAFRHFHQYLQGRHFTVFTDHYSLASILSWKDPPPRIIRWLEYFAEYDFTAKYKPGSTHCNADALSRLESRYVKKDWETVSREAVVVESKGPEELPPLSSWPKLIGLTEDDLPERPKVAYHSPLRTVSACFINLQAEFSQFAGDDYSVLVAPMKAKKKEKNSTVTSPVDDEEPVGIDSSQMSVTDVYELVGRTYEDPEDQKRYVIMDVWFDDSRRTYVAKRVPMDGSMPTVDDLETGIFVDSILKDMQEQEVQFHPAKGKEKLIEETFQEQVERCVEVWIEKGLLHSNEVTTLPDDEGQLNIYRRFYDKKTQTDHYQLIIPDGKDGQVVRDHLLYACHETAAHLRYEKMYGELRKRAWWPGMQKDCEHHAKSCQTCQTRGVPQDRQFSKIILENPVSHVPFETISIDILSLNASSSGMKYIIVAVDHFSKWVEAEAYKEVPSAETVNQFMMHHFYFRHGAPIRILADNGSNLTVNELNSQLFLQLGSIVRNTVAYNPRANGQVERVNQPICDYLSRFCNDFEQGDWDQFLDATIHAINTSVSTVTGYTPYFLTHGYECRKVIDHRLPKLGMKKKSYQQYVERLQRSLAHAHVVASENIDKVHSMYNQPRAVHRVVNSMQRVSEADQGRKLRSFSNGDWVMIFQPQLPKKIEEKVIVRKLYKHWRGPYQVLYQINELTYMIQINNKSVPININRLKPYIARGISSVEPF